jgi:hypothetical protein
MTRSFFSLFLYFSDSVLCCTKHLIPSYEEFRQAVDLGDNGKPVSGQGHAKPCETNLQGILLDNRGDALFENSRSLKVFFVP